MAFAASIARRMTGGYFSDVHSTPSFVLGTIRTDHTSRTAADTGTAAAAVVQIIMIIFFIRFTRPIRDHTD